MTESGESTELAAELALEAVEEHGKRAAWHDHVALSTLVIAVLAAAAALLAGITAHEVLIDRTEQIIDVAIAQSDLERAETLRAKHALLIAVDQEPDPEEVELVDELEREAREEAELAAEARDEGVAAGSTHLVLAAATTIFAVAIAVAGLSVIVDRRRLWTAGMIVALGGAATFAFGLVGFLS